MTQDFAVFICTHGRPTKQLTLKALLDAGYTGKYYLVLDDTDESIQQYIDIYGTSNILIFNKNHYINSNNVGTNSPPYKCILYAKNAVEDIAKSKNLTSFLLCDDDITGFRYRYIEGDSLKSLSITSNIDGCISAYNNFLLDNNLTAISFSGATVFFGGKKVYSEVEKWRIPFNIVFRNVAKPVDWVSAFSEDIVTGIQLAKYGNLCYSLPFIQFNSMQVGGNNTGGMHQTYVSISSVKRASYDIMYEPSCTKIGNIKGKFLPEYIKASAFPKLVSSEYRKEN